MLGAGAPASTEGHISGLIPDIVSLSALFPQATAPASKSAMAGSNSKATKGSSMRAQGSSKSHRAPRNTGPLLKMTVPHFGDGGEVEISVQVGRDTLMGLHRLTCNVYIFSIRALRSAESDARLMFKVFDVCRLPPRPSGRPPRTTSSSSCTL